MHPDARPLACAVSYLFASPHYAGTDDDDSLFGAEHKPLRTKGEGMPDRKSERQRQHFEQALLRQIAYNARVAGFDNSTGTHTVDGDFDDGKVRFHATITFNPAE